MYVLYIYIYMYVYVSMYLTIWFNLSPASSSQYQILEILMHIDKSSKFIDSKHTHTHACVFISIYK